MQQISHQTVRWLEGTALAVLLVGTTPIARATVMAPSADAGPFSAGFVYTESNLSDNSVLVFDRAADGALSLAATVPTGGAGGGVVSVGSQGALAVSQNQQYLFAANEGGNSISVLKRTPAGLTTVGVSPRAALFRSALRSAGTGSTSSMTGYPGRRQTSPGSPLTILPVRSLPSRIRPAL